MISFCDRALDLIGAPGGFDVLYAGGSSPLWLEGLAERIGPGGSLTALDADEERVRRARRWLAKAGLPCRVSVLAGDVFTPPFSKSSFDFVYSAGLLHELDVSRSPASEAIRTLAVLLRPGGRLATEDFVDSAVAAQLEDEAIEDVLRRAMGEEPYGIGSRERLISLHKQELEAVSWRALPPFEIRHMDRLFLASGEPEGIRDPLRGRWLDLRERVRREGYTRPATLCVEGFRPG